MHPQGPRSSNIRNWLEAIWKSRSGLPASSSSTTRAMILQGTEPRLTQVPAAPHSRLDGRVVNRPCKSRQAPRDCARCWPPYGIVAVFRATRPARKPTRPAELSRQCPGSRLRARAPGGLAAFDDESAFARLQLARRRRAFSRPGGGEGRDFAGSHGRGSTTNCARAIASRRTRAALTRLGSRIVWPDFACREFEAQVAGR